MSLWVGLDFGFGLKLGSINRYSLWCHYFSKLGMAEENKRKKQNKSMKQFAGFNLASFPIVITQLAISYLWEKKSESTLKFKFDSRIRFIGSGTNLAYISWLLVSLWFWTFELTNLQFPWQQHEEEALEKFKQSKDGVVSTPLWSIVDSTCGPRM